MKHAVLGAGGIGGLVAAALARSGADVGLLLRPETSAAYPGRIRVESAVLGDFEVDIPASSVLDREVDVLWVATKATQLESALALAPQERVRDALVIPFLNGIDHVELLRRRYPRVAAGAIRVESERISLSIVRQSSPFLRAELAGADDAAAELRQAGIECRTRDDELSLLWEKLAFLAPVAVTTTALATALGGARADARFAGCREEALAVAEADGAGIDAAGLRALHDSTPADIRSSMQKDVEAGREPELDAIAGPIVRGGLRHAIRTPCTEDLAEEIRTRPRV